MQYNEKNSHRLIDPNDVIVKKNIINNLFLVLTTIGKLLYSKSVPSSQLEKSLHERNHPDILNLIFSFISALHYRYYSVSSLGSLLPGTYRSQQSPQLMFDQIKMYISYG